MLHKIKIWWVKAIEPSSNTTDPEDRHKQRLLNMLLLIFAPVSVIFAVVDNLRGLAVGDPLIEFDTLLTVVGITASLGIIYYFSRRGKYNLMIPFLMSAGFIIVYINASITTPPHLEIIYLSLLIFVASDIFHPRMTLFVALLTILMLTFFYNQMNTIPLEVYSDIRLYFVIVTIFTFFISYHRDQLEKDRQQIIQRERFRLQLVLENLPVYVWTTNEHFVTTSIGGTLPDNTESALRDFLKSDMAIDYHKNASVQTKTYFEFEMAGHAYEAVIQAIQSPIDQHIDYIGVAVDVTDRNEREKLRTLQKRQEQQQEILGELLNSVSHDLRTPLSLLRTSTYLLERVGDATKRQVQIDKINRATNRLETTIEAMFKLVRWSMPLTVSRQPVLINQVVNSAITILQNRATERSIMIEKSLSEDNLTVEAIAEELQEVIKQVIQNAVQYSPDGSSIDVRSYQDEGFVVIEVEDEGSGILEEDLARIFDPFYRGEKHRPMDSDSIGIGLTLARRIVERHFGSIHAKNQSEGGCVFTIKLPLIAE